MHSVPLQLPLNAGEAGVLAGLIFQQAEGRGLDHNLRSRLGSRIQALRLSSMVPFPGSLQRDPIHPTTYYLAADTRGPQPQPLLLRLALASSPSSGLFPNAVLIGRMRTNAGHEVVVNAIRFGPADRENIRTFGDRVDPAFLPRPQGAAPSISVQHQQLESTLPGAFEAYRAILTSTGLNVAGVPVTNQAQIDTVLWVAIRAGWRDGYTVEAEGDSIDQAPVGCTKFMLQAGRDFEKLEAAREQIRVRSGKKFDLELAFDREMSDPEAIGSCLRFLRSRGRPAQFVSPHLDALDQLEKIAEVARQYGALIGVRSIGLLPATVLQHIGRATAGKISYRICQPDPADGDTARMIALAWESIRG